MTRTLSQTTERSLRTAPASAFGGGWNGFRPVPEHKPSWWARVMGRTA